VSPSHPLETFFPQEEVDSLTTGKLGSPDWVGRVVEGKVEVLEILPKTGREVK
jgi:hypothetical protein